MLGIGPKLHLDSLQKLGFDKSIRDQLASSIQKSPDGERVDSFNYVPLSVLSAHALKLGREDVATKLRSSLQTKSLRPVRTQTDLGGFPASRVSLGDPVKRAAGSGSVSPSELSSYLGPLQALLGSLASEAKRRGQDATLPDLSKPVPARDLLEVLRTNGSKLQRLPSPDKALTRAQVESLSSLVAGKLVPEHEEREAIVSLDSTFRPLAQGQGAAAGIRVFQKNQYEGFFVRRTEAGADGKPGFVLSGFKSDRIVVALPKDCSLLVVDSQGNERAAKLARVDATIGGEKLSTVEISRTLVEPDAKNRVFDPSFAVKVLDMSGNVLFEQALAFDKVPSWTSNELVRGTFDYKRTAESELDRFALDHGAPVSSQSRTPIGRRPSFSLPGNEGTGDRLVVRRDGQSFALDDLAMLLSPPKRATQAFSPEPASGPKLTWELKDDPNTSAHLDGDRPGFGATITNSQGKKAVFDPSLHQMMQARVGVGGVTISTSDGIELARFDPFDPASDRNRRRS
ncbi:MAG: hypothetical protein HYV07_10360 [Deltaproteobacteria bacterium]|nr:hypothetical protein [Deltaproteobacteria bacterium]